MERIIDYYLSHYALVLCFSNLFMNYNLNLNNFNFNFNFSKIINVK